MFRRVRSITSLNIPFLRQLAPAFIVQGLKADPDYNLGNPLPKGKGVMLNGWDEIHMLPFELLIYAHGLRFTARCTDRTEQVLEKLLQALKSFGASDGRVHKVGKCASKSG